MAFKFNDKKKKLNYDNRLANKCDDYFRIDKKSEKTKNIDLGGNKKQKRNNPIDKLMKN